MIIKRGIIQAFNPSTYTASVLLFEATSFALSGIPVSNALDGTSCLVNALCAVLFFDEQNPQDAVVIATFANGFSASAGLPTPAPGRVTFVTAQRQINASVIAAGTTSTFTLVGGSSNIPTTALGVLYRAFYTAPAANAFLQIAPHGATITDYAVLGALPAANATLHGSGTLALSSDGKLDIAAVNASCTVTLYTYGYIE